ncbi:SPW repeat domain-containing protein [Saccharomonospora viridis]|uniref:SPW repeat-containing integral membrane domain-containing protein n=1 Tax=Saccharomonospora viridis (strain ATCC 15386 / DSM 43017 / JCM 3036 / CCUG 5913 / NBRC 12207 / NCIMB 9602 / P101) TaxID=471857 RepID=C7MWM6_SACVD|nr:SPW repeat protein [Saccharomonospora viridis]ACU95885.1 hypothetical protein Svir_08250 [Saccharomonospora viridis DSM 43017]
MTSREPDESEWSEQPEPRPPAPEDNTGPWQGMRPSYANPSALPAGERREQSMSLVPYRYALGSLPNAIVLLSGVWLLVCAWLIEHPGTVGGMNAAVADIVVGLLLIGFGGMRTASPFSLRRAGVATLLLGGWLIAAPFALGYRGGEEGAATVNDVVTGAVVVVMSVLGLVLGARWAGRAPERGQEAL